MQRAEAAPTLVYDPREGCWIFQGFDVHSELYGAVDDMTRPMTVGSISSMSPGHGNTELALRWIKSQCGRLGAQDPGNRGTDSRAFWDRMIAKDIIDWLEDA